MSVECNRIRGFTYTMPYMREKFEDALGDAYRDFFILVLMIQKQIKCI